MYKKITTIAIILVVLVFGGIMISKNMSQNNVPDMRLSPDQQVIDLNTYTLEEVSSHATRLDCYTIVNDVVYNLTTWIDEHPGGDRAILNICGKDGSAAFNNQHGGNMDVEGVLSGFEIGIIKNDTAQ